jgi:hypothetical protein
MISPVTKIVTSFKFPLVERVLRALKSGVVSLLMKLSPVTPADL